MASRAGGKRSPPAVSARLPQWGGSGGGEQRGFFPKGTVNRARQVQKRDGERPAPSAVQAAWCPGQRSFLVKEGEAMRETATSRVEGGQIPERVCPKQAAIHARMSASSSAHRARPSGAAFTACDGEV